MQNLVTYKLSDLSSTTITFESNDVGDREELVSQPGRVIQCLDDTLNSVKAFGARMMETVQELRPSEAAIEFGVIFKAETGAIIAKSSMEGNVKIKLTWKAE